MARTENPLAALSAWQRFHLRITTVYAVVVVVVLLAAALLGYQQLVAAHLAGLQARLTLGADALALSLPGERIASWAPGRDAPLHSELDARFEGLGHTFADLDSIYVLRRAGSPTQLEFVHDWSREASDAASPGELYDASAVPVMLEGFSGPVAEDELYEDRWGSSLSAYAPVRGADGRTVAIVGLDVQAREIAAVESGILRMTLGASFGIFGILALVTVVVGRQVREPLAEVISAADALSHGHLDVRVALDRTDEFGILAVSFDRMAEGLAEREFFRDTFGRYVSPNVARQLLAANEVQLGGEAREVTVLMSDLVGYSTFGEALAPSELVTLLNRYLGAMQQAIDAEGGTVIEFVGDAIVAVFNAPSDQSDHADRAVRAALGMREAMQRVNEVSTHEVEQAGFEQLRHRIGVHTGTVVAGSIGSLTRLKYTVIGDAVNVAARIEALNKDLGTEILVSETTRAAADPAAVATATDRGDFKVKGREATVRVWEL